MPRYVFHLTDGREDLNPQRGMDLAGNAAAREEALIIARDLRDGKMFPDANGTGGSSRSWINTATKLTRCQSRSCSRTKVAFAHQTALLPRQKLVPMPRHHKDPPHNPNLPIQITDMSY